jgi:hypothetical protein
LRPVDEGRAATNPLGGNNCKVVQLPVFTDPENPSVLAVGAGDGWYYADFSEALKTTCELSEPQRVAFSTNAKPPTGVIVKLDCLNETQRYINTDLNVAPNQPEVGWPCMQDSACIVHRLDTATPNTSMFCHPELDVCQRQCTSDTDCPPAWICGTRQVAKLGKSYCVNPTCGADLTTD